jgi:hypothetical protein
MNRIKSAGLFVGLILMLSVSAAAQQSSKVFETQIPGEPNKQFQFLAFYINQGVTSNFYPQNEFLRGQVLGRMFGRNSVTTSDTITTAYVEQRLIPFFIYQPHLFDGRAILRAVFEIDWTWGDVSYGAGPNQGGAVSGHQVNIQTQNIELELIPKLGWSVNLGLQRMFDNPYNPYRTLADKMLENGFRMTHFGTHAVGVTLYRNADFHRFKAAFFKFYENDIFRDDDVNMFEFQYEKNINKLWRAALSTHYVRDRGNGRGGVSILGQGLNSQLAEYNGVFRFKFGSAPYEADVAWVGTHFSRNADYMIDRFFLNGFFNYNLGVVNVLRDSGWKKGAEIGGFSANFRSGYRYGQTIQDRISIDLMYTTGDENGIEDNKYSGVLTGNSWAAPGGFFINSGAYLLFPHGNVVNRFTPVIADISNIGYGFTGGTANFSKGIIPNRLHVKVGTAAAMSNATPIGGGRSMGIEANAGIVYNLGTFMSIELHGAHMWLGDFFDSADDRYGVAVNGGVQGERPVNPWTAFIVYKWLMF